MRPFSIRLFCPYGNPEGVLVASRDDWTGRAVTFPRELVGEVKGRREYSRPGVYILTSAKKMYIGEGDPVGERIDDHIRRKHFWKRGVFFTAEGDRLNKAHIQYLESSLVTLAMGTKRVELDNRVQPAAPALSEEDRAFADNFLHDIRLTLPLLGFWQFSAEQEEEPDDTGPGDSGEPPIGPGGKTAEVYSSLPHGLEFTLNFREANARLRAVPRGVSVLKGSTVNRLQIERLSLDSPGYAAQRRSLEDARVLAEQDGKLVFTQDQFFSSGSAAATVVRGVISNADWWKGPEGKSLGDLLRELRSKQGQPEPSTSLTTL